MQGVQACAGGAVGSVWVVYCLDIGMRNIFRGVLLFLIVLSIGLFLFTDVRIIFRFHSLRRIGMRCSGLSGSIWFFPSVSFLWCMSYWWLFRSRVRRF